MTWLARLWRRLVGRRFDHLADTPERRWMWVTHDRSNGGDR